METTNIRVYTTENFIDLTVKGKLTPEVLIEQLEIGNSILLEETNGAIFVLNLINLVGLEILPDTP